MASFDNNSKTYINATQLKTLSYGVTEQVGFTVFFTACGIWTLCGNGLVLYLTAKYRQFHEIYMYIRAAFSIMDIMGLCITTPVVMLHVLEYRVPERVSCMCSTVCGGLWLSMVHLTAILAYERYVYFFTPLKYNRYFTTKNLITSIGVNVAVTQAYMLGTEFIYGRDLQIVVFVCQLKESGHSLFQVLVYFVFSIAVIVFCLVKILRLISRINASENTGPQGQNTEQAIRGKTARRAVRLILLVSGAYWGTIVPYFLIRYIIIVQLGVTWEQLNSFVFPGVSLAMRMGQIMGMFSLALDPLIYFSINKNLCVAAVRIIRKNYSSFTWNLDNPNQA